MNWQSFKILKILANRPFISPYYSISESDGVIWVTLLKEGNTVICLHLDRLNDVKNYRVQHILGDISEETAKLLKNPAYIGCNMKGTNMYYFRKHGRIYKLNGITVTSIENIEDFNMEFPSNSKYLTHTLDEFAEILANNSTKSARKYSESAFLYYVT